MSWRLLREASSDPKRNLAVEEAILRARQCDECDDTLRLWRNDRSVIVGCFQDVASEVNLEACRKSQVEIVRRASGGGAVYNDLGNLNSSIVVKSSSILVPDDIHAVYEMFSRAMMSGLSTLGIEAEFHPPNNLFMQNKKISGMAIHRFYDTWMVHGTLLVNADLRLLHEVLVNPKYDVTNISDSLCVTTNQVEAALVRGFRKRLFQTNFHYGDLSESEQEQAENLLKLKYSKERWNLFGDK